MKVLALLPLMWLSLCSFGLDVQLFINSGEFAVGENSFSCTSFNSSEELNSRNVNLYLDVGEELSLNITNNTDQLQNLTIDEVLESDNELLPGEEIAFDLQFTTPGTYRYYSSYFYAERTGASGVIIVGYPDLPHFTWNLFDLNRELSAEILNETAEDIPSDYQPELFFINGVNHPFTLEDSETLVSLELDEVAIISVVNSGYMDHVLHFHGFHVEILSAQMAADRVGWIKDTIPLKSGEAMTFRLHANQEGIYPVHDHNLIAVTNIGVYPGGMLTQIVVSQ